MWKCIGNWPFVGVLGWRYAAAQPQRWPSRDGELGKKSKEKGRPGVFMLDRRWELGVGRRSQRVSEG